MGFDLAWQLGLVALFYQLDDPKVEKALLLALNFVKKKYTSLVISSQFQYILRQGNRIKNPFLNLIYISTGDIAYPKIGFIIKKKIASAVKRNLFRRITKEYIRHNQSTLKGKQIVFHFTGSNFTKKELHHFLHSTFSANCIVS